MASMAISAAILAEREACAKVAESSREAHAECDHGPDYMDGREDAASAIRARSSRDLLRGGAPA